MALKRQRYTNIMSITMFSKMVKTRIIWAEEMADMHSAQLSCPDLASNSAALQAIA